MIMEKTGFLLHTCCAPCGVAVIDELRKKFDLTVLFYNPNIYPEEEYLKRKKEVVRVCEEWNVPMIDHDHVPEEWNEKVRGLEGEPEGGMRCAACIKMRLYRSALIAKENGFEIFGTTLTMGRQKTAKVITPIGDHVAELFGLKYFAEDWKKGGRQETARRLIKEKNIYQQNYCGCKYSLKSKREE
jgi:predicted adenine nucleotide alpha hydrolase (AANH) superfamily ATPase